MDLEAEAAAAAAADTSDACTTEGSILSKSEGEGTTVLDRDREREHDDEELPITDHRVGPPDRRYRQPQPQPSTREINWPAIFATLVTIMIAMLGYATTILSDIKRDVRATSDRQIKDSAVYETERATLRRDIDEARNRIDTVVLAFQYNVNGRLTYLEAKTGHKAPKELLQSPQPPQLQGD